MKTLRMVGLVLLGLAGIVEARAAGPGLSVPGADAAWLRWQARLQLTSETSFGASLFDADASLAAVRTRSAALFGDVFLSRPWFGEAGGARLTSGLLVGQKGAVLGPGGATGGQLNALTSQVGRMPGAALGQAESTSESTLTWPYLGVGYSGSSLRHGLNFSADLGLAAQNPSAIRFGRMGAAGFDEWTRELRLTPVLQLGVSYTF